MVVRIKVYQCWRHWHINLHLYQTVYRRLPQTQHNHLCFHDRRLTGKCPIMTFLFRNVLLWKCIVWREGFSFHKPCGSIRWSQKDNIPQSPEVWICQTSVSAFRKKKKRKNQVDGLLIVKLNLSLTVIYQWETTWWEKVETTFLLFLNVWSVKYNFLISACSPHKFFSVPKSRFCRGLQVCTNLWNQLCTVITDE